MRLVRAKPVWQAVRRIEWAALSATDVYWLLPLRQEIRLLRSSGQTMVLTHLLTYELTPESRRLRIWLRGLAGGHFGTRQLSEWGKHPDPRIRKEAIRALRRVGGWVTLATWVETETDPRLAHLATARPARPYSERLSKILESRSPLSPSGTPTDLYVAPDVTVKLVRPPRPWWRIREVLERIRRLVGGGE